MKVENNSVRLIVIGDVGVGKSSVINLIMGKYVADVNDVATRKTSNVITHRDCINNIFIEVTETLGDPYSIANHISNRCIGYNIALCVIRKGQITRNTKDLVNTLREVIPDIPIMLVVTHCDFDSPMDRWKQENEDFVTHTVSPDFIICVTTVNSRNDKYLSDRYSYSRDILLGTILSNICVNASCLSKLK